MNIRFGVPKREIIAKKEMFPETAVITMLPWEGKGYNKKFEMNTKAMEMLGINGGADSVSFAFDKGDAFIAKVVNDDSVLVGKNKAFSNKSYYDYITAIYGLDSSKENYLAIVEKIELPEITVFKLQPIVPEATESTRPVIDKEIEHMEMGWGDPEMLIHSEEIPEMMEPIEPEFETVFPESL